METDNPTFFLLHHVDDFQHDSPLFVWNENREALTLAQNQQLRLPTVTRTQGIMAWENAQPSMMDRFGAIGRISPDGSQLEFSTSFVTDIALSEQPGFEPVNDDQNQTVQAPIGRFIDMAAGGEGRLALIYADNDSNATPSSSTNKQGLLVFDLRKRWQSFIELAELPERVCMDSLNRIWILGKTQVVLCVGEPLLHPYHPEPDRFEPVEINPHSLHVFADYPLQGVEKGYAVCEDGQTVYLLVDRLDDQGELSQFLQVGNLQQEPVVFQPLPLPKEIPFVTDISVISRGHIALLSPQQADDFDYIQRDCPVVKINKEATALELVMLRYPQLSQLSVYFVQSLDNKTRYLSSDGPRELFPLAHPRYFPEGETSLAYQLDSGMPDTQWDKVTMNGCIPQGCSLTISVRAYNSKTPPNDNKGYEQQHPPLALPFDSEIPFVSPSKPSIPSKSSFHDDGEGLFEILLQRTNGKVRELRGRNLQIRIAMQSDGRHTPAIHSMRVYYPRLSWQETWLPERLRQQEAPSETQEPEAANSADVMHRLLASFEGMLTPIEDKIVSSEKRLDPASSPLEMLPVIASMLGQRDFPVHWPEKRQRRLVSNIGLLQQRKGSMESLLLALDIATDGAVRRGQVVPLENFRFRRTLATILGVSLDDDEHPLTLGTRQSGNSRVGESLILSRDDAREFLALLDPESVERELSDKERVTQFFDQYAHQLTVFLHGDASELKQIVKETLTDYVPAHVQWRLHATDHPFVLGLAPLLEIDTWLENQPPYKKVVLDDTWLGKEGLLINPEALSPSWAGIHANSQAKSQAKNSEGGNL